MSGVLDDYIHDSELAKQLHVSIRTTARYRHEVGLPYVEVGNRVYVRRADVDAWLAKRVVKRNGKPASAGGAAMTWHDEIRNCDTCTAEFQPKREVHATARHVAGTTPRRRSIAQEAMTER